MGSTSVSVKGQNQVDDNPNLMKKDGVKGKVGEAPDSMEPPKPKVVSGKNEPSSWEVLVEFLSEHWIQDEQALGVFKLAKILSLDDLLEAKTDEEVGAALKEALTKSGSKFGRKRFERLDVESIKNALFFLKNADAKQSSQSLLDFLADEDVVTKTLSRDKLLCILLENSVTSLADLHKLKATSVTKLTALTADINAVDSDASKAFAQITAAAVARATGETQGIDEDLQTFLKEKAKLPAGSEAVLAEFGVTSLQQLKAVKEDPEQSKKLAKKFQDSGILKGVEAFSKITVEDIDEEVRTLTSPATKEAKEAKKKEAALRKAVEDVKKLRTEVEGATKDHMAATIANVAKEYEAVLGRVKDACDLDFEKVSTAAQQSQTELKALLDATIQNAENATNVLKYVDKTQMPLTKLIRRVEMLCGALVTPAGIAMKRGVELVVMPSLPDQLAKAGEAQESIDIQYRGTETRSFASSYASQTGSSLATSTDTSAAGFVGTGLAAVSAAASYSDARKASKDQESFESSTVATCGEIRYIYAPKQTIQFKEKDIRLSNDATRELVSIGSTSDVAAKTHKIVSFYQRFGSHFFTRCSLGGRYEFNSKGENTSASGKEKLKRAVSSGTDWAVSSSASYLGLGGAVKAAAALIGSETRAEAQAHQMRFSTDSAEVRVSIKVLGGAGPAPRDVWSQSLAFNSTWAVIGRAEPIAIWEIIERGGETPALPMSLAPVLEEVWVREIFRNAVRDSNPTLYSRIGSEPKIKTCEQLNEVVKELQAAEPPIKIVIVRQTSTADGHPKVIAQPNVTEGLKLIGGGVSVDYGNGDGNLLTGSYPSGEGWAASSKEHLKPSPAKVTAYAIYLVDPDDIWDVKRVEVKSERRGNRPKATAVLPAGYSLTGGGARVHDYGQNGLMLTHCCPAMKDGVWMGWTAEGKDHIEGDEGYATAWAIGIRCKNMLPGAHPKPTEVITQMASGPSRARASASVGAKRVVVGGGCAVTYEDAGGLLTGSCPDASGNAWSGSAKDHIKKDSLGLTTWAIARPGELTAIDAVAQGR